MTVTKMNAQFVTIEPGDRARYRFVIAADPTDCFCIMITSMAPFSFSGYSYRKDSIEQFIQTHGPVPGYEKYQAWAANALDDLFVREVAEKSNCNPWTALAAAVCMAEVLK